MRLSESGDSNFARSRLATKKHKETQIFTGFFLFFLCLFVAKTVF